MKNLLLLLLLLPALAAAKVPDEEDIQNKTMDAESPFYYPSLMMRYNAGDETLTDEDYHYLYYGYAYQESYKPLDSIPTNRPSRRSKRCSTRARMRWPAIRSAPRSST